MGRAVSKDVPTSPNLRTHACVKTKLYNLYKITRLDFFTFANFDYVVDMDFLHLQIMTMTKLLKWQSHDLVYV